jgi:membrane-associated protease RseP (regulator of RpoE activity)
MRPLAEAIRELGAPFTWREIAGFGHDPRYLPEERPAIARWMEGVRRDPHPKRLVWEGAEGAPARVRWLRVLETGEAGGDADFPDVNPPIAPARVTIGVVIDQTFAGVGVKIQTVQAGTPAEAAGLAAGDVIVGLDGAPIRAMGDLRAALGPEKSGKAFRIQGRRGEESIEKEGAFAPLVPQPVLTRESPWASLEATVEGNRIDVRSRRVLAFEVLLADALVDLAKPVVVTVNGTKLHDAVVPPDVEVTLRQWLEDEDRTTVYRSRLAVRVPPRGR